jgi:hypothetical protein
VGGLPGAGHTLGAGPIPARALATAAALAALFAAAPAAQAADPGRWKLTKARNVKIAYNQGITAVGSSAFSFSSNQIIFLTDRALRQRRENTQILPADVVAAEGYDHIGDLTYDRAEGGRLLLPLECYRPADRRRATTAARARSASPARRPWTGATT